MRPDTAKIWYRFVELIGKEAKRGAGSFDIYRIAARPARRDGGRTRDAEVALRLLTLAAYDDALNVAIIPPY